MTKGKLKAHLSKRYKGKIAEKIMYAFSDSMENPLDFNAWIDLLENLLNSKADILKLMIFKVLDYNEDNHVC